MITLKRPLDYESRSSYNLVIEAVDGRDQDQPFDIDPRTNSRDGSKQRSAETNVYVEVNDVQDQDPFFVNAPYSATVAENTAAVSRLLSRVH